MSIIRKTRLSSPNKSTTIAELMQLAKSFVTTRIFSMKEKSLILNQLRKYQTLRSCWRMRHAVTSVYQRCCHS